MIKRSMNRAEAEQTVIEAYRLALGREPDAGGLETYVGALVARTLDGLSLYKELLGSEEAATNRRNSAAFTERRDRLLANPEQVITDAYALVLGRLPDEAGMTHYAGSLRAGHLDGYDFLHGLLNSPEYAARVTAGGGPHPVAAVAGIPEEIILLIQEMIAARFVDQGCRWALPPIFPSGQVVPVAQVIGLIRTLVMLCETRPATPRAQ